MRGEKTKNHTSNKNVSASVKNSGRTKIIIIIITQCLLILMYQTTWFRASRSALMQMLSVSTQRLTTFLEKEIIHLLISVFIYFELAALAVFLILIILLLILTQIILTVSEVTQVQATLWTRQKRRSQHQTHDYTNPPGCRWPSMVTH